MEQTPNHNKHLIKSHFLRNNITKFLLSVSVFSLFFSHSSWICFNLYAFLSHNLDKNYIFLLFNGLVVYLAKTSGLISSASEHSHFNKARDHKHSVGQVVDFTWSIEVSGSSHGVCTLADLKNKARDHYHYLDGQKPEWLLPEKDVADETNESCQEDDVVQEAMTSDECVIQEKETKKLIVQEETESWFLIEEEEEEEEENGTMSTEELNKKFDDFIRKMKGGD